MKRKSRTESGASLGHCARSTEDGRHGTNRKTPLRLLIAGVYSYFRRRPTLPRSSPRSTIGSGGLDFRVRDGIGYDPSDIATETCWSSESRRRPDGLAQLTLHSTKSP